MQPHVDGVPPDGGWGWLIVLGSSIINLFTRAIEPSFGLLFGGLFRQLGVGTTGAAVVMSTRDFCVNFSGLFLGPLVKKLSYRKVAVIGAMFSSFALLASSFSGSMAHLFLTYGVLGGLGFGFAQASGYIGLNNYFLKRRGQAIGLSLAGTAIGFMVMPQIISFLLQNYDFLGAVLILGALSLNSFVGASLFEPVEWHMKYPEKAPKTELRKPNSSDLDLEKASIARLLSKNEARTKTNAPPASIQRQISAPVEAVKPTSRGLTSIRQSAPDIRRKLSSVSSVTDVTAITGGKKRKEERKKEILAQGCFSRFYDLMDFNLLKDGVYLNILFGISMSSVSELNFKMIVPFFMDSLGYTLQETAFVLSATAVADLLARLVVPPILDRLSYSKRTTLMISGSFVVVTRSALAEQTKTVPLFICFILHGFSRGVMLINFPLVLSEYATQANFPAVLGLSMVSKAIFTLALGPLVGYIRDYSDSYRLSIHVLSFFMFLCIAAWAVEYLVIYLRTKINFKKPVRSNSIESRKARIGEL